MRVGSGDCGLAISPLKQPPQLPPAPFSSRSPPNLVTPKRAAYPLLDESIKHCHLRVSSKRCFFACRSSDVEMASRRGARAVLIHFSSGLHCKIFCRVTSQKNSPQTDMWHDRKRPMRHACGPSRSAGSANSNDLSQFYGTVFTSENEMFLLLSAQ